LASARLALRGRFVSAGWCSTTGEVWITLTAPSPP
jgi:hypothetical protein